VPEDWATPDTLSSFEFTDSVSAISTGSKSLALDSTGTTALIGGNDGSLCTFSVQGQEALQTTQPDGSSINSVVAYNQGDKPLSIVGKASGEVSILSNGTTVASFTSHAGAVTGLALHPCGDLLLSVGVDKSFVYYNLADMTVISQVYTDSGRLTKNDVIIQR